MGVSGLKIKLNVSRENAVRCLAVVYIYFSFTLTIVEARKIFSDDDDMSRFDICAKL